MCLIAGCISIKVEIRVVGHVHNSRLVGFRFVADVDSVIVRQFHQHLTSDIARETFFTIFCHISQFQFLRIGLYCIKHPVLESLRTAMQTMTVIILRQLILCTVQCEFTLIDTVGITTDACSKVRRLADIILNRIEAEHYITHLSVFVGYHHRNNTATEVRNANFHVVLVAQGIQISFLSIYFHLEVTLQ